MVNQIDQQLIDLVLKTHKLSNRSVNLCGPSNQPVSRDTWLTRSGRPGLTG
ncbi:hypothetical protein AXF42_Ash001931 [Apostasia shenzhenica]|uniref:Uncharacterized protein n=1 Tax=Apostasia shenzhenica TaxID=1088818 RepID=A0A2I0ABM3_9ASPA|nr:hypothetical protein AXF42_Ash001931 [Apostasia shenzhenica]